MKTSIKSIFFGLGIVFCGALQAQDATPDAWQDNGNHVTFPNSTIGHNVGIGNNAPTAKLHVTGADILLERGDIVNQKNALQISISGSPLVGVSLPTGSINFLRKAIPSGASSPDMSFSANGTNIQMIVKNGGNVGIGTTNPTDKLMLVGALGFSGATGQIKANMDVNANDEFEILGGTSATTGAYISLRGGAATNASNSIALISNGTPNPTGDRGIEMMNYNGGVWKQNAVFSKQGNLFVNDNDIYLRGIGDIFHGLGYYGVNKTFGGITVDGPVLYGTTGGVLGTSYSPSGTPNPQAVLTWKADGNVGINATNPTQPLQLGDEFVFHAGGTKYIGRNVSYMNLNGTYANYTLKANQASSLIAFQGDGSLSFETNNDATLPAGANIDSNPLNANSPGIMKKRMIITADGKVVMGDVNNMNINTPYVYGLYVQKGILTEKVKAALVNTNDWADYVFANDYKLKPLAEVEEFIQNNKHLPGVPSADELVKEGGIDMNVMFAKQMEKIEEMTLYMIEMNKKLSALQTENMQLKEKMSELENTTATK